ncbi:hypothetical protein JL107_08560 [Nakamurella flavida]|uniref:VWA domain-containing protein n=1 Tax=Nakamurella flavida TaxID=363630 RepID=A0A939C2E9_9ACTN|nr:hypothetical protein [Nakamurella flavida]MBM9476490.1 hypothetical protein [Nakamurella flavida]MDP9779074.1 hypothetical protein [Nakamurella flavida]
MAVHLQLHQPVPAPAAQLRVEWQGFRPGDTATAGWTGPDGEHRWEGGTGLRWLQRDTARSGEEWRINLDGVPGGVDRLRLSVQPAAPRVVGVAVSPLTGNPDDSVLHPGASVEPGCSTLVLELLRTATGWGILALAQPETPDAAHTAETDTVPDPAPASRADSPARTNPGPAADRRGQPRIDGEPVRSVPVPAHLQAAVDAARSSGAVRRRSSVAALVDLSASMRPALVDGRLAAALRAVQAVAGASSQSAVSTSFLPGGSTRELSLEADPGSALFDQLTAQGLVTGNRTHLIAECERRAGHGGLQIVLTDDPSLPAHLPASVVTVLVGAPVSAEQPSGPRTVTVTVTPVDVPLLARGLAECARTVD